MENASQFLPRQLEVYGRPVDRSGCPYNMMMMTMNDDDDKFY